MCKADERSYYKRVHFAAHTTNSLLGLSLLMSMDTGTHPATHSYQSHTWKGLWLFGRQHLDQHVTKVSDKPWD